MFQSPNSIAFSLGSLGIHWYGLMIVLGIFAALWYSAQELKRHHINNDVLFDLGFWVILFGVIGARLYYIIFQWDFYRNDFSEIFAVWNGGLAIHGALLGGFLAFIAFTSLKKLNWLMFLDVLMPGVILAQAFGRWGNFFNNEAFGGPTNLPWKLFIPETFRPVGFEAVEFFHPTFLYESLWNFLGFIILAYLARKIYKSGTLGKVKSYGVISFSYLIYYSFGRFFIEGLRLDSLMIGSFRVAQVVSVILLVVGVYGVFIRMKHRNLNG